METSEVLNLAADHIQQYGLEKGRGHGDGDFWTAPACTIGALGVASWEGRIHDDTAQSRGMEVLRDYIPVGTCIPDWSDAPERTAAEVIEALRACALIESAREQDSAWQTYATNVARVTA